MDVFVDGWLWRDLISVIFEEVPGCPEGFSLSTLVRRSHKQLCKNLRDPEEKNEESYSSRSETRKQSVRSREAVCPEYGVKTHSNEDDGQISQYFCCC